MHDTAVCRCVQERSPLLLLLGLLGSQSLLTQVRLILLQHLGQLHLVLLQLSSLHNSAESMAGVV